MCGRYSSAGHLGGWTEVDLRRRFPLGERVEVRPRYNVAPADDVLAVTTDREGAPRGELLRWGLVPHWADDPRVGMRMINARAETVATKPAFRDAFERRRCLVVADGFFEWQHRGPAAAKLPWHVTRTDRAPFAFAGLWARWTGPDGQELRTCTIVTTAANVVVRDVHDRMPVMLPDAAAEQAWLDPGTGAPELRMLLAPLDPALTARRAVGPAVNDARHDAPDCLDDAPADLLEAPATLF
jgi:putative SOS response-associated peptidase YedK